MKSEQIKEEVVAKVSAPAAKVEPPVEVKASGKVQITQNNSLRNEFAVAVADHVLKGMDITYLEGHSSIPNFARKVFLLADALVAEANK